MNARDRITTGGKVALENLFRIRISSWPILSILCWVQRGRFAAATARCRRHATPVGETSGQTTVVLLPSTTYYTLYEPHQWKMFPNFEAHQQRLAEISQHIEVRNKRTRSTPPGTPRYCIYEHENPPSFNRCVGAKTTVKLSLH